MGGPPFPDGEGPDSQDSGAADEVFAAVVLDEDFVSAAQIHEPSAAERARAAAGWAEPEGPGFYRDPDLDPGGLGRFDGPDREGDERADGRGGFDPSGDLDGPGGPDDPDDPENEGRFDRSDYTRYLPEPVETWELRTSRGSPGATAPPGRGRTGAGAPTPGPSRRPMRWQRPVACVLAMVMSLSVIALTWIAIQRANSPREQHPAPPPPATRPDETATQAAGRTAGQAVADGHPPEAEPAVGEWAEVERAVAEPARVERAEDGP